MSWAIEEYVEDALVAYLEHQLNPGLLALYAAWSADEIKYPCVVVHAGISRNVEGTGWTGHREMDVIIGVMTPVAAVGAASAREKNREYRNAVVATLAQTALHSEINALSPLGVVFSRAEADQINRSVERDAHVFLSEINLRVIASAKDLK